MLALSLVFSQHFYLKQSFEAVAAQHLTKDQPDKLISIIGTMVVANSVPMLHVEYVVCGDCY